jgi:competence protein ComEC
MRKRLKKKLHVSWFIAWASFGLLLGVAFSIFSWSTAFADVTWLFVSIPLFIIAASSRLTSFVLIALAAGLILGLWRGATERHNLANYNFFYNKTVSVSGKISEDASFGPHGDQRLQISLVKINGLHLPEKVWVSTFSHIDIRRGDIISVYGKLNKGFSNFPGSMYYANITDVSRPYPGDIGRRVRDNFANSIKKALPEPEASLGVGYLVGQRSSMPQDLDNQFKTVGLTHAVVASGYNLTILIAFASSVFAKKSKYLSALTSFMLIFSFILITGFSPSMSRAGLVCGLSLLAWYYGRKIHPLILLLFSAAITALIKPSFIWGDIGWYLSFTAFAGVIILGPLLQHYFWGANKNSPKIRALLIDTLAAQMLTAPIIIYSFHQYSPYALVANLLVLPFVPFAMLFTFIAGLFALVMPNIAGLAGTPAYVILRYSTQTVGHIANLPNAKVELNFSSTLMIVSYLAMVLIMLFLQQKTGHRFREEPLEI